MSRIKIFFLCLAVLGAAGLLHHQWQFVTPASAATLQNGSGQSCTGTGLWHFVHNQDGGATGSLCATFSCGTVCVTDSKTTPATTHYYIGTSGSCSLVSATDDINGGRLLLSDFSCTPAPSPTPTPSPSPTPTP